MLGDINMDCHVFINALACLGKSPLVLHFEQAAVAPTMCNLMLV